MMHRQTIYHLTIALLFLFLGANAELAAAQEGTWAPPAPSAKDKDWIRISSGEWLWGTIDLMRDESLEFDSEELDVVTIDWEDIAEIRSARVMTYVMINGAVVTGTSTLQGDTLQVLTTEGAIKAPRHRIQAILEGEPTEWNYWSAKIGADLKTRTGNTNQNDFGGRIFLKREAANSRIDLKYQINISETQNIETVNNRRFNAEWKKFLSRKFFVSPIKGEMFIDDFQNIKSRNTIGAGVGYFFVRSSKADWYLEVGGAYQETKYNSVEPGENEKEGNATAPVRTTLETDITDDIELNFEYGVQIGFGSEANSLHHTFLILEFDLWGDIDFSASVTWDHATRPKTNAEGITPNKDDVAMAYGLSINF